AGAGLGEDAVDRPGGAERQRQAHRQRRAGVDDRGGAAEGVDEEQEDPEERADDVDDDVLANEVGVGGGDGVAAGVLDLRQRRLRRRVFLEVGQRAPLHQRAVGEQRLREWHILRRTLWLRQDEERRVIGRQVVAARGIEVHAAAGGLELPQEDRREVEGVVLHELLEGHRLRRFQQGAVARHRLADALVGELGRGLVELRRREEEQRARQDDLHEVERVRDLVRDVLDARVLPIAVRDG